MLGKTGLDSQNKKIRALARGLQEVGGMDVIYTGLYRNMEEIVRASREGAVDAVVISTYTGTHMKILPELKQELEASGQGQVMVLAEGLIPARDQIALKESGVLAEVFSPTASTESIIKWIQQGVRNNS